MLPVGGAACAARLGVRAGLRRRRPSLLGAVFVWSAPGRCLRMPRRPTGRCAPAKPLFAFSILYLFALFAALLADAVARDRRCSDEPLMIEAVRASAERQKQAPRRGARSRSALALAALVVLFYITTIVKLGGNVVDRAM